MGVFQEGSYYIIHIMPVFKYLGFFVGVFFVLIMLFIEITIKSLMKNS